LKLKIPLFPRKQKTKNRNLKFVIPAQAGIQSVRFRLF
ncbi:pilS cassette, partial [Neisseria gonorrhoeae]